MKVLNRFTLQNLKLNKKRTIVTIIGIVLSTALICAVAGMVTSFQQTLINVAILNRGNCHTTFKNVESKDAKYIENNANVESYFKTSEIGWANLEGSKNEYKPYVRILGYDARALENNGVQIVEGRIPEKEDEIIISEEIVLNGRVDLKVGDKITLDVGTLNGETIDGTKAKTYEIVGTMKRPNYNIEQFESKGYTVITYTAKPQGVSNIYVLYNNPNNYAKYNDEIMKTVYGNTDEENIAINTDFLRFQGVVGDAALRALYTIGSIVIAIIVVTSVLVIRNSFSISVAEKNKQYGMLSSIGATTKQIKKSVLFEGLIVGLIAIPLGMILGIVAIVILIAIINGLLGNMLNGISFVYSVPVLPMIASVIISTLTIYLSCLIPAKRASKISPVESIRGNNDINIKGKKLRTPKFVKKIFGIGGVISSKNLKRSRKKYRTTIISIVLSIFIFIALSSFMECGEKLSDVYYTKLNFNIVVEGGTKEQYEEIAKNSDVKEYGYFYESSADISCNKYGTEKGKEVNNNKDEGNIALIVYNRAYFDNYCKKLGVTVTDYTKQGVLIDEFHYKNEKNVSSLTNLYNIKNGQSFDITLKGKKLTVKNLLRTDERPMGQEGRAPTSGSFIVSEEFVKKEKDVSTKLLIYSENTNELENTLNDMIKKDDNYNELEVTNYKTIAENENRMYLLIAIFLYGFILVISLIGVTNIFNTITTNMILRSKEFAMLKSVGMTTKEFNNMIVLESLLYGLRSLLIGIPIGILGSYAVYQAFAEQLVMGYTLPVKAIILSIVFVFIIVGATMKYSLNKINKQNIIETIRKDNI